MNKAVLFIFLILIIVPNLFSQDQPDNLYLINTFQRLNSLSSRFEKQLNTYDLHSILFFASDTSAGNTYLHHPGAFNYSLSEDYSSTFIKSADRSSQTVHYFSLNGAYDISSFMNVGAEADNNIFSDSRRIEINQASVSDMFLYSEITPYDSIFVVPFFGYENNRQIGQSDYGLLYGGEGNINESNLSNFILQSQLKFKNEDISPRRNLFRYVNLNVRSAFDPVFTNSINYEYFLNRKDFYFTADSNTALQFGTLNNIQSRIETNNILQDSLAYLKFFNIFALNLTGRVSWRSIDRDTRYKPVNIPSPSLFDTRVNELRVEFESAVDYKSELFNGTFHLNYSERDEDHLAKDYSGSNETFFQQSSDLESQKNNISKRISASVIGDLKLSSSDKLSFSLFQSKLRYDTPSQLNFDDRDELLSIIRLQYLKTLSPFFDAFVNLEGTLNHIVYIFSESSSNNNINRILRLATGGEYKGKNFSSFNSFEVSANYTVYDFEDLVSNYQSYSFRQYTATDSSRINLSRNLSFTHFGYIKLSEQGNLKWASFATQPTRFLSEIYSEPELVTSYGKLIFSFGLRFYSLTTYRYDQSSKVIDSRYNSIGPVTEISLQLYNSLLFKTIGWYEFINTGSSVSKQQATLSMQMNWAF